VEKYTTCSVCGASILEKCAIEENGKILCGDCVVKDTNKDVAKAEKIAKEKRDHAYEQERRAIALKQKKRAILLFIVALIAFAIVQILMQINQPEPVKRETIDFSNKLPVAQSLINIGIYKYSADNQKLPATLNALYPLYLPAGVDIAFAYFSYKVIDDNSYALEIIHPETSPDTESELDEK